MGNNEDPNLDRVETRLTRLGTALRLATFLEAQRQGIVHRLDEKLVPGQVEEQFRSITCSMGTTLDELRDYINREFEQTRRERNPAKEL